VTLLDDYHARLRATIKTAALLDDKMVAEITNALKKLCNKNVLTNVEVDETLLGGVRVEMGGMVFDGSVKAKLAEMKNQLIFSVESNSI
jgi:F-type H+-transporting ATPase subunit delta